MVSWEVKEEEAKAELGSRSGSRGSLWRSANCWEKRSAMSSSTSRDERWASSAWKLRSRGGTSTPRGSWGQGEGGIRYKLIKSII